MHIIKIIKYDGGTPKTVEVALDKIIHYIIVLMDYNIL
jgi:hypothetical protein